MNGQSAGRTVGRLLTVSVDIQRDEWDRILRVLQAASATVHNDAVGDRWDIDSAIASSLLRAELTRIETVAAIGGPTVALTWTPDRFGLFIYALETALDSYSFARPDPDAAAALSPVIRMLRATVSVTTPSDRGPSAPEGAWPAGWPAS